MSQDYAALKVPDLKKLLTERGLPQTGNKADLVARLQENDKSMSQSLRYRLLATAPPTATATATAPTCILPLLP